MDVGDIVRTFQESYLVQFGNVMMPSQKKALSDIADCATPAMGGRLLQCGSCKHSFWIYYGCRNRSCPKCHGAQTCRWLKEKEAELLPCPYFHLIVTVPQELHSPFMKNQKFMYGLFMRIVSYAVMELAGNPKYIGATPAVMTVLHTWNGKLEFHPHVHLLISGGGLDVHQGRWLGNPPSFLIPIRALSRIVAARMRDTLRQKQPGVFQSIPKNAWKKNWCSFCVPYGSGQKAVLNYLGRYVFRIAISRSRLVAMTEKNVTFRYKDRKENRMKLETISGVEFLRRFLLHVLPRGFHKVRYYGLWHASHRREQKLAREILEATNESSENTLFEILLGEESPEQKAAASTEICPCCGQSNLCVIREARRGELTPRCRIGPPP